MRFFKCKHKNYGHMMRGIRTVLIRCFDCGGVRHATIKEDELTMSMQWIKDNRFMKPPTMQDLLMSKQFKFSPEMWP